MPAPPPTERYVHLRDECVRLGLRLTPQRDVLLRILSDAMGHPTADDLVRQVRAVLPTVSHATVYRNLQELVRVGLIRTLDRAGAAAQFEVNPDEHHHFVCRKCGKVWDIYLSAVDVTVNRRRTAIDGFQVDRREVQLHGLCAPCGNPPHKAVTRRPAARPTGRNRGRSRRGP